MEPADGHPTIQHCMRSFEPYLAANRRTEKPVIHLSLNPHPDDVLSDEQLAAIGQEYMEKMGYGNQPYIIYRHEDIGRPHIHIVSLRIDEQGKKINDYKEWQRSSAICRELEKKYHLLPAEKMEQRESLPLTVVDYHKGDIKHQIANVVKPIMQGYKFQSVKEFKALLGLFHVTVEETHKTIEGKTYHGLVYAATDEKGERTGVAIKSSKIGKSVGYEALQKKLFKSKQWMAKHPVPIQTKETIATALQGQPTRQGFLQELSGKGIAAILWQNDSGVIYGVTYIDHHSKTVFKGSLLGKEYSASVINRKYGTVPPEKTEELPVFQPTGREKEEPGLVEGLLDIFSPETYPYPADDLPQSPYGKKKKKKRRGPHLG
ncbi:conjugal transfer protein MobB [Bacteroides intestinalis]|uniref:conjugal transfer protein MobB n=1 Tax=Bacteroides intestinalis TaxID=329854 RepID=UPI0018A05DAF|nr:conjugal transfer protein MobB [Bacteroides intestinalis]